MKSKNVVQLHEVNTHTKESIKTTRSKCGGLFVRIIPEQIEKLQKKGNGNGKHREEVPCGNSVDKFTVW